MFRTNYHSSYCHRLAIIAVLSLAALATGGCKKDEDTPKGTLVIPFKLGAGKSCEDAGVTEVRVTLDDDQVVETAPCEDGEVQLSAIESGIYSVKVYGLDSGGTAVMDSLGGDQTKLEEVKIEEGSTIKLDVVLTVAPARLEVRWELGFNTCESLNLEYFKITAWNENGDDPLLEAELKCMKNGQGKDNYREIPDPGRTLKGDDFGKVQIQPYDINDTPIGSNPSADFDFESPGPGQLIQLSVSCDSSGCDGSGEPD